MFLNKTQVLKLGKWPNYFVENIVSEIPSITVSTNVKLIWHCPVHGVDYEQTIGRHLSGAECPKCGRLKNAKSRVKNHRKKFKFSKEFIQALDKSPDKDRILNGELGVEDKAQFYCKVHDCFYIQRIADRMRRDGACPECTKQKKRENVLKTNKLNRLKKNLTVDDFKDLRDKDKIQSYLAGEIPLSNKDYFLCKEGHLYQQRVVDHLEGHGCPTCAAQLVDNVSSYEKRLSEWLNINGIAHVCSCRTEVKSDVGRSLELDIYVPEYKLAIEVNGIYYHSYEYMQVSKAYNAIGGKENYHKMKTKACADKGIRLIHLFEDDLRDKWDLCLNLLKSKLYLRGCRVFSRTKVGARSLDVRKFDNGREFFDKYHINGYGRGNCYGLFDGNNLVSAIQVRRTPSNEDNAENSFILDRYCTVFDMNVVGGIERLMKFAEKDLNIKKWISYADITISDGALYKRLGFDLIGTSKPDYRYVYKGIRIHKFNFRIKRFRDDESLIFEEGKSESQLAEMNGLKKIYDCGKLKFVKLL